ncbi:MAG: segregation and condensation protein A [Flavonifractor plautii]
MVKARDEAMEDFNGPLDLILHLLSKNRMEIKDIQISLILDQYLEWMDQRKRLDLEVASEFVTMAAHLVFIKTRMLALHPRRGGHLRDGTAHCLSGGAPAPRKLCQDQGHRARAVRPLRHRPGLYSQGARGPAG